MIRSLAGIMAGATAVAGCAGPIETRVQTHQLVAAPQERQFTVSSTDAVQNRDLELARELVANILREKGYRSSPDAAILVHVALSDRPADIAVVAGDENAQQSIAAAKQKKRFQSCKDQEHRLTISLFDQGRGAKLYSGNAAEYHCNGTIAQSLPFLVGAALSGLDDGPTDATQSTVRTRQGIE